MEIFDLIHIYLWINAEGKEIEEIKSIGTFSSHEKAQEAISFLIDKKGFRDHPISCFEIHNNVLDRYEWKEGFIDVDEAKDFDLLNP